MENITKDSVVTLLSGLGFTRNENGIFQREINTKIEEIDWKLILSGENPPCVNFNQYLNKYKFIQHKNWSEDVIHHILRNQLITDKEDIAKQLNLLVMSLSEVAVNTDDLLQESIMVNIGVDTGDSCSDYTANTVPPAYGADHTLKESEWCASIVWLTKQQGHKKGELYFALSNIKHNPELIHTELMKSIANEVCSTLTIFTQLFFFVKMTVYDLLLLNTLLQWHHDTGKWGGYILLNKDTATGFYAPWEGSSSAVGILLEQDVKLPIKYISEIMPDSAYRYPLNTICGSTHLWDKGRISYMSLPKHFRRSMADYGLFPQKKNVHVDIDNSINL